MLLYRPVFGGENPKRLRGFALAVVHMDRLRNAARRITRRSWHFLSCARTRSPSRSRFPGMPMPRPDSALSATSLIFAFGRVFAVTAHAGPHFMRLHPVHAGLRAALVGLLLSAALTVLISMVLRRREQLERLVFERTAALRQSEMRHRLLFDGSHDAMMTLAPPSCKFTSGNPSTLEMFRAQSGAEFTTLGPWNISPERQPDGTPSPTRHGRRSRWPCARVRTFSSGRTGGWMARISRPPYCSPAWS